MNHRKTWMVRGLCALCLVVVFVFYLRFSFVRPIDRSFVVVTEMLEPDQISEEPSPSDAKPFTKWCTKSGAKYKLTNTLNENLSGHFPPLIHRMWKDENIPKRWNEGARSCRDLNPDHVYCHWTDRELEMFIASEYPWFLVTYLAYGYEIQRADAARYFLVYHFGGVYLDLDLVCRSPFKDMLNDTSGNLRLVFAAARPVGVTGELLAAKRPRDPFMLHVISGLQNRSSLWYVFSYPTIIYSTGPMYLSDRLWDFEAMCNGDLTWRRIFSLSQFGERYFTHLVGSSWHRWDGVIIWNVFRWRYVLLAVAVLMLVLFTIWLILRIRKRVLDKELCCKPLARKADCNSVDRLV